MSSLMDKLDHTAAVKEDIRNTINTLNGSQVVSTSMPFDQYSQYIKNKDWGFFAYRCSGDYWEPNHKTIEIYDISNPIPSLNINDYKQFQIWTIGNIDQQSFSEISGNTLGLYGDMRCKRTYDYQGYDWEEDIYDDNITECNYCAIYNLKYEPNASILNSDTNYISVLKGSLNSGSHKYDSEPDSSSSLYNCYWYSIDYFINYNNQLPELTTDFFSKITMQKSSDDYIQYTLTIPNYKVTLWNPYTQSYFQKEVCVGDNSYAILGILKD